VTARSAEENDEGNGDTKASWKETSRCSRMRACPPFRCKKARALTTGCQGTCAAGEESATGHAEDTEAVEPKT